MNTAPLRIATLCLSLFGFEGFAALSAEAAPSVFVDEKVAQTLVFTDNAIVLDARGHKARAPYLPRAQVVNWTSHRAGFRKSGLLAKDVSRISDIFEKFGISSQSSVLVYGSMAKGFGEEGRIWWTLRYLGVEKVQILNGGINAWTKSGHTASNRLSVKMPRGTIQPRLHKGLRRRWPSVNQARLQNNVQLVDVRSKAEFMGKTPYGSKRGGHIPGALHLPWKTLLGSDNRILDRLGLEKKLNTAGFEKGRPAVTYCTGGVRSAFVVAVLMHYGLHQVSNYDGSWWEWSSLNDLPVSTKLPQRP